MMKGETIQTGVNPECCGKPLRLRVCLSAAGYYVGTVCPACGPYSRESGYYPSAEAAEAALASGNFGR